MRGCGEASIQWASCPEKNTRSIDWWNFLSEKQCFSRPPPRSVTCRSLSAYTENQQVHLQVDYCATAVTFYFSRLHLSKGNVLG